MNTKTFYNSHFTPKGDYETNWNKAVGYVPQDKEIIIYKPDATHPAARFKVGDGKTVVQDLPFAGTDIEAIQQLINEKGELLIEYVDNAVSGLASKEWVTEAFETAGISIKQYIDNSVEGLASEEYVKEQVALIEIPEITVDQAYHSSSENAQSGVAIAGVIQPIDNKIVTIENKIVTIENKTTTATTDNILSIFN